MLFGVFCASVWVLNIKGLYENQTWTIYLIHPQCVVLLYVFRCNAIRLLDAYLRKSMELSVL